MDAILHIYYKNNDVILNTKQIKTCYNILWLNTVSNALQASLPYYVVYFFSFPLNKINVVYDIIVHMHENSFYVCVGGNHFELEGQTKVISLEKYET